MRAAVVSGLAVRRLRELVAGAEATLGELELVASSIGSDTVSTMRGLAAGLVGDDHAEPIAAWRARAASEFFYRRVGSDPQLARFTESNFLAKLALRTTRLHLQIDALITSYGPRGAILDVCGLLEAAEVAARPADDPLRVQYRRILRPFLR